MSEHGNVPEQTLRELLAKISKGLMLLKKGSEPPYCCRSPVTGGAVSSAPQFVPEAAQRAGFRGEPGAREGLSLPSLAVVQLSRVGQRRDGAWAVGDTCRGEL